MGKKSQSVLGATTFFAKRQAGDVCGSNGLPVTPNSISIFGQSQILKTISHPSLCEYVDIIRGKHERIIVVSEYYGQNLCNISLVSETRNIAHSVLSGLDCLNELNIVHRCLCPENILQTEAGDYKLFNYGLYHMTDRGANVAFPIGYPKYMSPEVLIAADSVPSGPKCDVWSLGLILAEIVLGTALWTNLKLVDIIQKILSLASYNGSIFELLAGEHNCLDIYTNLDEDLKRFVDKCLNVNLENRPTPSECLRDAFLCKAKKASDFSIYDYGYHIGFLRRVAREDIALVKKQTAMRKSEAEGYEKSDWPSRELARRNLKERYFFWQLAGGDLYSELKKQGMIKAKPPILSFPNVVLLEGSAFGEIRDTSSLLDLRCIELPMRSLKERVAQMSFNMFHPLLETNSPLIPDCCPPDARFLPLIIREKDIEYQLHRVVLFHKLLLGYPSNREKIIAEAQSDITPFFRGDIWAALLGVIGDIEGNYVAIDKETHCHTDRQIDVDIPRCHQYNDLLASPTGHKKLKRVLKAWVIANPKYVYWQGLDSLCAPFLYLNFNNEAQAYACLSAFIPKYLNDFFLKDNSAVIQEHLAKFRHVVAFHDPELACHLDNIHFIPELFAIPWFLTVFSHVFPLHKILYLWDKLLLGDASFPFHIGLAILHQLRDTLLSSGFNECILLFSDLPDVDIERCVRDSTTFYEQTPRSITYRAHEQQQIQLHPLLDLSPVPLKQIQEEFCPRISASDMLTLLRTPENVLVVDIRSMEDFAAQSVPDSINIPFNLISLSEHQVPSTREGKKLEASRGRTVIVVGSGGENLTEFCRWLVYCGFPYVCILHGGIQVLAATDVIRCNADKR